MPDLADKSAIFHAAIAIEQPAQREAFLVEQCGDDDGLRAEISEMVAVHAEAKGFLSRPPEPNGQSDSQQVGRQSVFASLVQRMKLSSIDLDSPDEDRQSDSGKRQRESDAPTRVGRKYQLHGEVARGGMGAILKGRDVDLGRNLAVKVLLEEHRHKPEVVSRFIEEAQIGGQLQHPGIAPVYELGQLPDERPFFSMKFVKGKTLAVILAERTDPKQDRAKLLGIFEQICQTMAYAHSRRVIHRDLKPANIMVGAFGEVQVMDWGLAKVLSNGGVADERRGRDAQLGHSLIQTIRTPRDPSQASVGTRSSFGSVGSETHVGSVMGTPAYMPPEQALGELDRLDERCDVFGLGAILSEILTGAPAYVAEDSQETFRMATRGQLDDCFLRLDASDADTTLIELTKECLAPEIANRPRSAGQLSERFSEYLSSVESRLRQAEVDRAAQATKTVEERKRQRVTIAMAAGILLMLSSCGCGWLLLQQQQAAARQAMERSVKELVNQARLHQELAKNDNLTLRQDELNKAVESAKQAVEFAKKHDVSEIERSQAEQLLVQLKNESATVAIQVAKQEQNKRLQDKLQFIRLSHAGKKQTIGENEPPNNFGIAATDREYRTLFAESGLEFGKLSIREAAKRIRESDLSENWISAIDHWTSVIPRHKPSELAGAWMSVGNWKNAKWWANKALQADLDEPLNWLNLATILVMLDDRQGYTKLCNDALERFKRPESIPESERITKICLLMPSELRLERLPSAMFEQALDDEDYSSGDVEWYWATRSLLAFRRSDFETASQYAQLALDSSDSNLGRPLPAALLALSQHSLGDTDSAAESFSKLNEHMRELYQDSNAWTNTDGWIAHYFYQKASEKIAPESSISSPLGSSTDQPAKLPESIARERQRSRLLAIANMADTNAWRCEFRKAIGQEDQSTIRQLATNEAASDQSPEIIAWLGATLRDQGELATAIPILRLAQQKHPDDFWLNHELAECLLADNQPEDALGFARAALAVRPDSQGAKWSLVASLDQAGDIEQSKQLFTELLASNEWSLSDLQIYATKLYQRGWSEQSLIANELALEIAPNDHRTMMTQISVLSSLKRHEESVELAKKAVRLHPEQWNSHFQLGHVLTRIGDDKAAADAYRRAVDLEPNQSVALNNLATVLQRLGDLKEAASLLRKAIEISPTALVSRRNLINVLKDLKELPEAPIAELDREILLVQSKFEGRVFEDSIDKYRRNIQLNPRDIRSRKQLATVLMEKQRYSEAADVYREIVRLTPDSPSHLAAFAGALMASKQWEESITRYRQLVELEPSTSNRTHLARALYSSIEGLRGKFVRNLMMQPIPPNVELDDHDRELLNEAKAHLQSAIENPDSSESVGFAKFVLSRVMSALGDSEKAESLLDEFKQEVRERAENKNREQFANAGPIPNAMATALGLMRNGKLAEAEHAVKEFISNAGPETRDRAHAVLARIYLSQGKVPEAEAAYQQSLSNGNGSAAAFIGYGELLVKQERIPEAIELYEDALKSILFAGARARVLALKAKAEAELGQVSEGINTCERGLKDQPGNPLCLTMLAKLLMESGDRRRAIRELNDGFNNTDPLIMHSLARYIAILPDTATPGELNEAKAYAQSAVEGIDRYPGRMRTQTKLECSCSLGIVLYRMGEWEAALGSLQKADGQEPIPNGVPSMPDPEFDRRINTIFLAMTHWQLDQKDEAKKLLSQVKQEGLNRVQAACFTEAQKLIQ